MSGKQNREIFLKSFRLNSLWNGNELKGRTDEYEKEKNGLNNRIRELINGNTELNKQLKDLIIENENIKKENENNKNKINEDKENVNNKIYNKYSPI